MQGFTYLPFGQNGVFATKDIADGALLCSIEPIKCLAKPDIYTVQYDDDLHIGAKFLNHSCDPNIDLKFILSENKAYDQTKDGKR